MQSLCEVGTACIAIPTSSNLRCVYFVTNFTIFVSGFLVAERRKLSPGSIRIVDSVPALHASYGLASAVESALICIDAQCAAHDPPLCIVGVYYANERYHDERCDEIEGI